MLLRSKQLNDRSGHINGKMLRSCHLESMGEGAPGLCREMVGR